MISTRDVQRFFCLPDLIYAREILLLADEFREIHETGLQNTVARQGGCTAGKHKQRGIAVCWVGHRGLDGFKGLTLDLVGRKPN